MVKTIITDTKKGVDLAIIEACDVPPEYRLYMTKFCLKIMDKEQIRSLIRGLQFAIGDKVTEAENA